MGRSDPQTVTLAKIRLHLIRLLSEIAKIPENQITDSAAIDRELVLDSVAFVELQVATEEAYDIEIDPIRILELNQFGAIAEYVYQCALEQQS